MREPRTNRAADAQECSEAGQRRARRARDAMRIAGISGAPAGVFESKGSAHLWQCTPASGPPCGRGRYLAGTKDGAVFTISAITYVAKAGRRSGTVNESSPHLLVLAAHCGARGQTVAVSASWPGKQLDSPEERETELSMSWVSSAVTCTAKFRMHQQGALPWALAIFWLIYLESAR